MWRRERTSISRERLLLEISGRGVDRRVSFRDRRLCSSSGAEAGVVVNDGAFWVVVGSEFR